MVNVGILRMVTLKKDGSPGQKGVGCYTSGNAIFMRVLCLSALMYSRASNPAHFHSTVPRVHPHRRIAARAAPGFRDDDVTGFQCSKGRDVVMSRGMRWISARWWRAPTGR